VIEAKPVSELADSIDSFDVILLGPQIRFRLAEVKKKADPLGKPVGVIEMRAYGTMDGQSAITQARQLLAPQS
jgi:PTS system cellobiose-specific IIB component